MQTSTRLMRWGNHYRLGSPEVDRQHEDLITLLNDLHDRWLSAAGPSELRVGLDTLIAGALDHFKTEEQLMRSRRYARYPSHKAEHDAFAAEISRFRQQFANGEAELDAAIFDHLALWLRNHLMVSDKPMGREIGLKP